LKETLDPKGGIERKKEREQSMGRAERALLHKERDFSFKTKCNLLKGLLKLKRN